MFYTIQNGNLLIADKKETLSRFYNNVQILPDDYEEGKYVVEDNELVLNPDFDEQKEQQEKDCLSRSRSRCCGKASSDSGQRSSGINHSQRKSRWIYTQPSRY